MNPENKQKLVLVVDDDIDFLTQNEIYLKAAGFDVVKAESQMEAEKLLATVKPDIALLDLMMENVDGGFALAYIIKQKFPNIPVIIATAVASETGLEFDAKTDEEKSWIKADAFLAKPVRPEQLIKEINNQLANKA